MTEGYSDKRAVAVSDVVVGRIAFFSESEE